MGHIAHEQAIALGPVGSAIKACRAVVLILREFFAEVVGVLPIAILEIK